jgi:ABC-type transport system substrate-binding protein
MRWSLEHMLSPDTACPGASFYRLIEGLETYQSGAASHISGIRVRDRYTFDITLTHPDQTFIYAMAMTFAYPVAHEAYDRYGSEVSRHPVGTGAYVLERWEPGVEAVFRRNPHYFIEGQPYVDRMVYTLNLDRRAAVMRFRNGDLDHIHRQTPSDYLKLRHMEAWEPYRSEYPITDVWGVEMNCQLAPFDNRHIRRAVAFALDRQQWRRARTNRLLVTGQPIPHTLPGYEDELPDSQRYDLARAREEMRLAGYPDGLPEPVEVWLGEGATGRAYGELIQHDLAAIGIEVEIKQVACPIYLEETGKPRTAQMLLGGWQMDFPDPSSFLDILFHSRSIADHDSTNRSFYSNPELDRILDEARVERDPEHRRALYLQAERILIEDAPWAFAFSNLVMEVWQPYVRNYRPHRVWHNFYRDVWLDLPRERWSWGPRAEGPAGRLAAFAPFAGGLLP